jgi:phospholipid/cholesterol/gamma-HCH transport system substrate-binding protein
VSFVQLKGGTPGAPLLREATEQEPPVIPSTPSAIQELFEGAPELVNSIIELVNNLNRLVNEENRAKIGQILTDAQVVSGTLARRAPELDTIIVNLDRTNRELAETMARINGLIGRMDTVVESTDATLSAARGTLASVDTLIDKEVATLLQQLQVASANITSLTTELNRFMKDNRQSLDVFASDGLVQFARFIEEARLLIASASRLVEDVQSDPAQFLFGRQQGVEAER